MYLCVLAQSHKGRCYTGATEDKRLSYKYMGLSESLEGLLESCLCTLTNSKGKNPIRGGEELLYKSCRLQIIYKELPYRE